MKLHQKTHQYFCDWLEKERFHLSRPDALLHLALLGVISGFLAGGTIVLFRFIVENIQDSILPGQGAENYEELAASLRFLLPIISSLLLALLFYHNSKGIRVLGIAHVIERMAYHQGYLTLRAFLLQFFGAAFAIIGGHSVGREGPHVHLGASVSSLFGQVIKAPNNSIRTLMACGSAAGIAASFNTPLAGVIFALEVVMMEYTL
ncbi:MAG TPA: chloride channel protein, partial [Thiothrix sp.]|nr:chloride channel protein [Thiothrix sp.]